VFIIAIDGRAASGKTTFASELAAVLQASVIHMDDFFLPKELAGRDENIHYERFAEEVLPRLREGVSFSYRIFNCATGDFSGEREVPPAHFYIIEGSYSCHPVFGDYADFRFFCDISPTLQLRRIINRDGEKKARNFLDKWIPLEEKYFKQYKISQKADLILATLI
jgi:uridine kinase